MATTQRGTIPSAVSKPRNVRHKRRLTYDYIPELPPKLESFDTFEPSPSCSKKQTTTLDHFGNGLKCSHLLKDIDDQTLKSAENEIILKCFGGIRSVINYYIKTKNISQNGYNSLFQILSEINPPPEEAGIVKPNLGYLPNEILSSIAQYLNIIDLKSFQLISVSFALLGRLYGNILNAKLYLKLNTNYEIRNIIHCLIQNDEKLIMNKLNSMVFINSNNALQFVENGIIYQIIKFIKSDKVSPELKMCAIDTIGRISKFDQKKKKIKKQSYDSTERDLSIGTEREECYFIYMKNLIQHNVINSFSDKKYQLFLTPSTLKYNIYCSQEAIWTCSDIRAFRKFDNHWKSRGKGTIKIYNVKYNGLSLKLLSFFDEKRNMIRLLQFIQKCSNYKYIENDSNGNISFRFQWIGIDHSTKIMYDDEDGEVDEDLRDRDTFSFRFNESEKESLLQLAQYFDEECDDKRIYPQITHPMEVLELQQKELRKFSYIEYDHIFCSFYALQPLLQKAVLRILSNDITENMIGIKYLSGLLRAGKDEQLSSEQLDNLMKTGIVLKIIELCQCKNVKLQYQAVDTLTNIASINDEFTNMISIFGGIQVLNGLLAGMHRQLRKNQEEVGHDMVEDKDEDKEDEKKDIVEEEEEDEKQLLEAIIWCIGNISGTVGCRSKLNEYWIYHQIMENMSLYRYKVQSVAAWTITHIFSDKGDDDDMNGDIIDSIDNISEILFNLFQTAHKNNDIQMCNDVLFCCKEYVNQCDEIRTNEACKTMIKTGFVSYLLDYIYYLLYQDEWKLIDYKSCLARSTYTLHSIIDQVRIYQQEQTTTTCAEDDISICNDFDFKGELLKCLCNKRYLQILSHETICAKKSGQLANFWIISHLITENEKVIEWILESDHDIGNNNNNPSLMRNQIIDAIKSNERTSIHIKTKNEACFIITTIIQQIGNYHLNDKKKQIKHIQSLIKIGIMEALFIMMENKEYLIECLYCMDIIYQLSYNNLNKKDIISPYIAKLDELLNVHSQKCYNNKFNDKMIRKIKSTKQRFKNLLIHID